MDDMSHDNGQYIQIGSNEPSNYSLGEIKEFMKDKKYTARIIINPLDSNGREYSGIFIRTKSNRFFELDEIIDKMETILDK